ncbi:hypothetical protein Ancab_008585 [Ancistrocladus abbreviatus]
MAMEGKEVSNKQMVLRDYMNEFPKESDMELKITKVNLKLPEGLDVVLVKNLYLSIDPFIRIRISKPSTRPSFSESYKLGLPIRGFGVAEVVDSGHPEFKKGDLVWGMTSWEEYTLIMSMPREGFFKIEHIDVPLSYYTGILGTLPSHQLP